MSGIKDKDKIKAMLIELAKEKNYVSRENLASEIGVSYGTIKNYAKDVHELIDIDNPKEYVQRNKGKGLTTIEKYSLKPGLDNLLAVFDYIDDKKLQKQLMQTEYYKTLIPEIKTKITKEFQLNSYRHTKKNKLILDIVMSHSPNCVNFFLKVNSDMLKKAIPIMMGYFDRKGCSSQKPINNIILFQAMYSLFLIDCIEGITDESDYLTSE
jgi:hypothetical protein